MRLQTAESNPSNEFIQTKLSYESSLINNFASTNDSNIIIRSLTNSNLIPTTVYLDSLRVQDDFDKATLFNQYFHSVFTTNHIDLPRDVNNIDSSFGNHLVSISISEAEVLEVLNSLDPSKSMALDPIF